MPARALAEAHGEPAPGHHGPGAPHAGPRGHRRPAERDGQAVAGGGRGGQCVGRRRQRVEDRLVADPAAPTASKAVGRGRGQRRKLRNPKVLHGAGGESGLDEGRPVQRARRSAHAGDESRSDAGQDGADRGRLIRIEHLVDRGEADQKVVAVVSISQGGVETREQLGVAPHGSAAAPHVVADGRGVDGELGRDQGGAHPPESSHQTRPGSTVLRPSPQGFLTES